MLGMPLALDEVVGPSTALEFLGIVLDTECVEARLPCDKLSRTQTTIGEWLNKRSTTKREILSLVGVLQHVAKVVRPGRTFVCCMYSVAARVQELDYFTHLNKEFKSNLYWWHLFFDKWNGISFLQPQKTIPMLTIQTDASGAWECAGFFPGKWFQLGWTQEWAPKAIMAKELVPIVISCATWGPLLVRKSVLFQCDNTVVVAAVSKSSAKEPVVMHLLRSMWFFVAHFDISISIEQISGVCNGVADMLSRDKNSALFSFESAGGSLSSTNP